MLDVIAASLFLAISNSAVSLHRNGYPSSSHTILYGPPETITIAASLPFATSFSALADL